MKWKLLCIIATICLIAILKKSMLEKASKSQTISQPLEYTNGGPRLKESFETFTYRYTINGQKEIILIFDSTNISAGDNYRFVEFLQVIPLLPARYTFNLKVNTTEELKNAEVYKDFYIYNFKVVFEQRKI